jgi:hypothetical protein
MWAIPLFLVTVAIEHRTFFPRMFEEALSYFLLGKFSERSLCSHFIPPSISLPLKDYRRTIANLYGKKAQNGLFATKLKKV